MGYSAPRGTVDILPGQSEKWIKLEQLLRTIAANYNVKEMRTPIFEHAELFKWSPKTIPPIWGRNVRC